jgi:filamentous hemagglutinin family protein
MVTRAGLSFSNVGGAHRRHRAACRGSTAILRCLLAAGAMLAGGAASAGPALPTGGSVASGTATIGTPSNGSLTVNQSSNKAIVNWNSFSIGQGGTVTINNGSGATLNRVTGSASSAINGNLNATGSVYLINPNGVIVGKTGVVKVGGNFVASTLNTSDAQFNAGGSLTLSGGSTAAVVNYGKIGSLGGDVALVARTATNAGTITAPNGAVGVLAGSQVTLRDSALNDGKFSVDVGANSDSATNSGTIQSADAELKANGGNVYALAGNTKGVIAATGTSAGGGKVFLSAVSGDLSVSGTVTAQNSDGSGGQVTARANNITVSGTIDASATAPARTGGTVSVIGTGDTGVTGHVHAAGNGATGGTIETSGHTLSVDGADVSAGEGGQWLLDPYDLTVTSAAASTIDASLNAGTNVTLQTTASGTSGPGTASSSGNGDIFVNSALSWNTTATLALNAYRNVAINAPITLSKGTLAMSGGSAIEVAAMISVTGAGSVNLSAPNTPLLNVYFGVGGSINFGAVNNGAHLSIDGTGYALLYTLQDIENIQDNATAALATSLNGQGVDYTPASHVGLYGFKGTFEGLGNTITHLNITHSPGRYFGLFSELGTTGTVRDLVMTDDSVNVGSQYGDAGAIVGFSYGTIANVYVASTVVCTGGCSYAGEIAGFNYGTITNSFVVANVSGAASNGGIAGVNGGTITNSYATGTVTVGVGSAGGLVGYDGYAGVGYIGNTYSTVAIAGTSLGGDIGGFVVFDQNYTTIENSYWDVLTSGTSYGGSQSYATGLTTSQLQGALPSGFSSAVWGTGANEYPYLKSFYPNGIQAVSGKAYVDRGTTPAQGVGINLYTGSAVAQSATTAMNGYFYFVLAPGTISASGTPSAVSSSGGADVQTLTATASDMDIWGGNSLIAPTAATTLSQAEATPLEPANVALISAATGGNAGAIAAISAFTNNAGYVPTGASFTIDHPVSQALFVAAAHGATITVADPIAVTGEALTLKTSGALAIDAPITVGGYYSAVTLAAGYSTSLTNGGASVLALSFAQGAALDFGPVNKGASLVIDSASYKLLYSGADIAGINSDSRLSGDYALADPVDLASYGNWLPLGADASGTPLNSSHGFTGIFEGLGNTVSNLSVDAALGGFFGYSAGTIRDIGIVGGTVTGTANQGYAGGLVAYSDGGLISGAFTDITVLAANSGFAGGLAGYAGNTVITDSYAAGSVVGGFFKGGLVGWLDNGSLVSNSYATDAVSAGGGGLIGDMEGGQVADSLVLGYARQSALVLLLDAGTITQSYFDTDTTGAFYGTGGSTVGALSDAALIGALPAGFDSAIWGTGAGLYPYLKSFFPITPQAVTGTADPVGTPVSVGLDAGGSFAGRATTNALGAYYIAVPAGTFAAGSNLLAYVNTNAATGASNEFAIASWASGNVLAGVDITNTVRHSLTTGDTTLTAALSDYTGGNTANDANALSAVANADLAITATGSSFTLDTPLSLADNYFVTLTGANASLIVADPITVSASGDRFNLVTTGTLAVDAPVSVTAATSVTLGTGIDTTTVPGTSLTELSFGAGDGIDFGATNNFARLSINGTRYTLLYGISDLAAINTDAGLAGKYALADSLDFSGISGWTPLGTNGANVALNTPFGFSGIFEGLGNTISNLAVNTGSYSYSGLFGITSGTIRDLGLNNVTANGVYSVGPLAGLNGGVIANVSVAGTSGATGSNTVGGLVGHSNAGGRIVNATAGGTVSGATRIGGAIGVNDGTVVNTASSDTVSGNLYVGGFVGQNDGTIRANSSETGNVTATGTGSSGIGGFAGMNYTAGVLSGDSASGNVAGSSSGGTIDMGGFAGINVASLSNDSSSGQVGTETISQVVGGLVGRNYGTIDSSGSSSNVEGGNQTGGLIGFNTGALMNSTQTGSVTGTSKAGGAIGENNGTTVSGDTISATVTGTQYVGGFVGQNDAVSITNSTASGNVTASVYASGGFAGYNLTGGTLSNDAATGNVGGAASDMGGLVGVNAGMLSNDSATGITGDATTQNIVGGLVGRNYGTVTLSKATGAVKGHNEVGGLVGWSSGAIGKSFATGNVTGVVKVGGLVGENDAGATNVYATGNVTGTQYVGGLVGNNQGAVTHAYATGHVTATAIAAGFAGANVTGTGSFSDDYWDTVTTGQSHAVSNGANGIAAIGGAARPSPTLQATYAGFDFANVWIITPGARPTLIGLN